MGRKDPLIMAAIGWLMREGKIELKVTRDAITVKLK
ncbi:MAG: winged helix-turn-helix domain-containing protein [Candidatus Altiarchaeota archaeon]|nr:winged helix-turn-helix domain-containing protein [Candidatus Altiarchaeota archaeon]